jgi:serine/threonine protein kinase
MNLSNSSTMTAESVCPVQPGEVIAGKYRVDRVVGAGGMGVVVAATHLQLHHLVAIKLLAPRFATYELAMPRFLQEARAAARIQNEHVVRVFDVGVLPDGPPYIAMEYLDGVDLDRLIDRRGPLPLQEAIECLLQACEGIAEAHAVGVVHRDLKPGNLVRCEHPGAPPLVKVVDFGVSKLRDAQLPSLVVTGPSEIVGSPLYASPEQLDASRDVDERADIWALGAVGYAMLAGRPPFAAESFSELCVKVAQARPASLGSLRDDVPEVLADVIERCLRKDRRERYRTIAQLATALAPFASQRALVSVDRIACASRHASFEAPPSSPVSLLAGTLDPVAPARSPPSHSLGALRWVLIAAMLAIVAVAVAATSSDRTASVRASASPAAVLGAVASDTPIPGASSPVPATRVDLPAPSEAPPATSVPTTPPPAVTSRPSRTSGFGGML